MQNRRSLKIVIGIVVVAALAVTAGPYIYINFIKDDAPKTLSIDQAPIDTTATTAVTDTTAAGAASSTTYTITSDSQVGYRVVEVLFGQDTEEVGRTNAVTGSITLAGTSGQRSGLHGRHDLLVATA